MKTRAIIAVCVVCVYGLTVHAQDVTTMSEAGFRSYIESCKKRGNDCYAMSGNKYELKRIIDEYQGAIERRSAAGTLDAGKRAELMQGVNKLWGDYYYLDGEEHPQSYAEAEGFFRACIAFAENHHEYQDAHHDLYIMPQELAQLYYPDRDPSWALRLFKQDLLRAPGLIDELRRRGWTPRRRLLRKDWVTRIFAAIEPP